MNRFCPVGHDKYKPHGAYVRIIRNRIVNKCAVCERDRNKRYDSKRKGIKNDMHT